MLTTTDASGPRLLIIFNIVNFVYMISVFVKAGPTLVIQTVEVLFAVSRAQFCCSLAWHAMERFTTFGFELDDVFLET